MTMDRRQLILGGAALAMSSLHGCGGGNDAASAEANPLEAGLKRGTPDASSAPAIITSAAATARVLIVGGGMAGTTMAKYLRLWGSNVDVTLVERAPTYTSCIMSSLVLSGQRSMSSLQFKYDALRTKYGVKTIVGDVTDIDPVNGTVVVGGTTLTGDRVILAPGIDFDDVPGLSDPNVMPHAWKAGSQTTLLRQQLVAMPAAGTVVLTIPKAPYRCPPGPYERACLLADWLRKNKPGSRLVVLDANADFVTEKDNFSEAFFVLHANVIQYHNNAAIDHVDQASKTLYYTSGAALASVRADVANLIPAQRAGSLIMKAGLNNATNGRFAAVNVLDYSSTAAPGKIHVLGDASATTQPKAGHIANQEAKVCADALVRIFAGGSPDPAPVTNSACFSTITMSQASWLHALFQYDAATAAMASVAAATGASVGWDTEHFEDMGVWFKALMADTFA